MGALSAYYAEEHADAPVRLETPADVDAMVTRVKSDNTWPLLVQVYVTEDIGGQELSAGFYGDVGVLRYSGPDAFAGVYSRGEDPEDPEDDEPISYFYMTADTEFPANAEIPVTAVRDALVEYLESNGARPTNVEWQERQ